MVLEAGFTNIELAVATIHMKAVDLENFSRGLIFGNPLFDQIKARGGPTPDLIQSRVLDLLRDEFGSNPSLVPLQAIFYSATKPRSPA